LFVSTFNHTWDGLRWCASWDGWLNMFKPPDQDDRDIRGLPLIHQVTSMTSMYLLSLCFNHEIISYNHYEQQSTIIFNY
jgi:hypothetical protein